MNFVLREERVFKLNFGKDDVTLGLDDLVDLIREVLFVLIKNGKQDEGCKCLEDVVGEVGIKCFDSLLIKSLSSEGDLSRIRSRLKSILEKVLNTTGISYKSIDIIINTINESNVDDELDKKEE